MEQNIYEKRIEDLKEMIGIQCCHGNYDYDPYMHGMANGMIFSLAVLTEEDPQYVKAPNTWLCDKAPGLNPKLNSLNSEE
ncbi:MAG: hypothetical protein GY861_22200 [bacterium]|nr:hypothetical protein [bacterium]